MFGFSKQAYYKWNPEQKTEDTDLIKSLIFDIRSQLPRLGVRKIYYLVEEDLRELGIKLGRDKLYDFMRTEGLLVPKRQKYHKTTNSRHWMKRYPNIIKDLDINHPEQVWVADITYLKASGKHYYLHLITDAYSKKIVGYQLADNLLAQTSICALQKAIESRKYTTELIHHSDRGLQYCSSTYTKLLKQNHIRISMTEQYDPYENAIAERVNGILKEEFDLDDDFGSFELLQRQVHQAITLYNQVRPHTSIDYYTPNEAHLQHKIKLRKWKSKKLIEASFNQLELNT